MHITSDQKQRMEKIFKKYGVEFAYLFGSSVIGNSNKASDIDIAVYLRSSGTINPSLRRQTLTPLTARGGHSKEGTIKRRFEIRLELITELSKIFPKNIDLVVLNDIKSVFFRYVILKEGSLIYTANEGVRVDTECAILNEYFDFKPFLDMYNKNFIAKKAYAS